MMHQLSTGTGIQAAGYEHLRDDKTKTPLRSKYESRPKKILKIVKTLFRSYLAFYPNACIEIKPKTCYYKP